MIKGIHDLVASITGFSEQRGDQITVETLPFESTLSAEPATPLQLPRRQPSDLDLKQPILIGAAALVLLLVIAVVFLLVRRPALPRGAGSKTAPDTLPARQHTPRGSPEHRIAV